MAVFYYGPGAGVLDRATYVRNPLRHGHTVNSALAMAHAVRHYTGGADALAIETMRVYDAGNQKGDQNDLLAVQLVAGAITGILSAYDNISYLPAEWKGTIDGDVCTERIIARLSDMEKSRVALVSDSLDHNTYDGVGIGLKRLGRFEPRRVFARE